VRDVSVWLAVFRVVVVVVVKLFEIEVGLLVERYGCERNLSSLLFIDRATLLIFSDMLLCGAVNRVVSYTVLTTVFISLPSVLTRLKSCRSCSLWSACCSRMKF
jgi:hypothetical protein